MGSGRDDAMEVVVRELVQRERESMCHATRYPSTVVLCDDHLVLKVGDEMAVVWNR